MRPRTRGFAWLVGVALVGAPWLATADEDEAACAPGCRDARTLLRCEPRATYDCADEGLVCDPSAARCVPPPGACEALSAPARGASTPAPSTPPFQGTAFTTPRLLTANDPTSLRALEHRGVGRRTMFDRRSARFDAHDAHLFLATFGASTRVEVQVNPEMSRDEAERHARRYAEAIGRLPAFRFRDLDTVWIHRGEQPFGGGNRNLLIHTEQGERYARGGHLEEILLHEATHTSLDAPHASDPRWRAAQRADGVAISRYAAGELAREDLAETLVPYLALRFRPERADPETRARIRRAVPSRLRYLDCLDLSMDPPR